MGENAESAALIVGYVLGLAGGVMMAFEAVKRLDGLDRPGPIIGSCSLSRPQVLHTAGCDRVRRVFWPHLDHHIRLMGGRTTQPVIQPATAR
jgi:hypothetical protein